MKNEKRDENAYMDADKFFFCIGYSSLTITNAKG